MKQISLILLFFSSILNARFADDAVVFAGNANKELAQEIAHHLGTELGEAKVGRFNDGEINIQLLTNVRQKDVYIIQSICPTQKYSVNDMLVELFLLIRTIKRSSARSITVVIPYYGYARQDRKTTPRVPVAAADMAFMIESAGINRVLTIDLHCGQIQGFFRHIPVDNLYAAPLFARYCLHKSLTNIVVVSPDAGGVERAQRFQSHLHNLGIEASFALISKQRAQAGVIDSMKLIGAVEGCTAIIVDDMCDTGGTIVKAAELLKEQGAQKVIVVITHPVFSKNALQTVGNSVIDRMIITNTIPLRGELPTNISCISVAPLLAEAMKRTQNGESVSALF